MKKKCKVSIIIPVYNAERYLEECLDCVVNQTLQEIEIICVNDGSTDNSRQIIESFVKDDERIFVIDKKNTGYGNSVNLGMKLAQGEYVGVVEADDYLELNMMEELYDIAVEKNLDIVKADFDIIRGELGKRKHSRQKICKGYDFYNKVMNSRENADIFYASLYTWAGIYRRAFLLESNIWHNETPGASYQDNGFWFQTFVKAQSVYFVEKSYYRLRRDNPDSSIKSREKVYCICQEYDFIREKLLKWEERKYLGIQWYWRYKGYIGTLKRIDSKYIEEFLERFREDFLIAGAKEELDLELFSKEEKYFLKNLFAGNFEELFRELFFDRALLQELKEAGKIILYGEEDKVRDICKRLSDYNDFNISVEGVALNNGKNNGMVWNQKVESLQSVLNRSRNGVIWLAITDENENNALRCLLEKKGYQKFIKLPSYIKGIKNV